MPSPCCDLHETNVRLRIVAERRRRCSFSPGHEHLPLLVEIHARRLQVGNMIFTLLNMETSKNAVLESLLAEMKRPRTTRHSGSSWWFLEQCLGNPPPKCSSFARTMCVHDNSIVPVSGGEVHHHRDPVKTPHQKRSSLAILSDCPGRLKPRKPRPVPASCGRHARILLFRGCTTV